MNAILGKQSAGLSIVLILAMLATIAAPGLAAAKVKNESIVISSFTTVRGDVSISAGTAEGIKAGQKGTVVRDGKKIADYTVREVKWGISWITLSNVAEGEAVKVGDSAPLTLAPEPAAKSSKKSNSSTMKTILTVAAIGLIALLVGKSHSSSSSSSNAALTLAATKTTNQGSDKSTSVVTITATVKDASGANVADGTTVTFSTTLGALNRASATTSAGKATATLTAETTESPAVVTVTALGKTATITVSFAASIDLTASESTIRATGSAGTPTESTITATCRDAQGNLATSGTVEFTTTIGTVVDEVDIASGVATTTFSSSDVGSATITARWSGTTSTVPVEVTAGPAYAVSVTSSTSSVQCDGNSYATIRATVTDLAGNKVTNGTVVKFSVTPDGTGGGNGTITSQATTTNGVAEALLYSKDSTGAKAKSGTATIKVQVLAADQPSTVPAQSTDLENQATQVEFISIDVAEISLGAAPTNIRGWDTVGNKSTVTAIVYTTDRGPVPDGTVVSFRTTHGMITSSATTTGGIATTTLTTDSSGSSSWNGLVDVTATAGAVSSTGTGLVIFSGPPSPSHCQATISQATLAKSGGQATIYVEAKDINGNPIVDDTTITATTSKGTVSPSSSKTSNGVVMFTLATSTDSTNPTEAGAGTVTVTIPSGGKNAETGGLPVALTVDFTVNP